MSTTVISDAAMVMSATDLVAKLTTETTEVESANCECCGLTEECTPEYIQTIRERYQGKWICGLCGEAVKDEIVRSERLITTEEAMARHVSFCRTPISSSPSPDPTVHLIAAVRQILRRRSMPSSPTTMISGGTAFTRPESCVAHITVDDQEKMN